VPVQVPRVHLADVVLQRVGVLEKRASCMILFPSAAS
jgi:hypothetical protein